MLSLLLPGFGLLRANLPARGIKWFLAILLASVFCTAVLVTDWIPFPLAVLTFFAAVAAQIRMLVDSFRPGRMTKGRWMILLVMVALIIASPNPAQLVARAFRVPTAAMTPALSGGRDIASPDCLLADRLCYLYRQPKRGDIIVFRGSFVPGVRPASTEDEAPLFISRIAGLPGERIRIADGRVHANGTVLGEQDGLPGSRYELPNEGQHNVMPAGHDFTVGPEQYFVLGDNSANSFDSRYWGAVPAANILGKATVIYYPFNRMGRPR